MNARPLIAGLVLLAAAPLSAAEAPAAAHVGRLGDESFARRRAATWALVALGDRALPALKRAMESSDPEVRARARLAARMIRWRFTRELARKVGDPFAGWAEKKWHERERLVLDVGAIGGADAVPTLEQVLKSETSEAVRRAAAIGLLRAGPRGLLALERSGGDLVELNIDSAGLRIQIGNGFLEEGKHRRALAEYRKALELDPKNDVAWYNIACAYSLMERIDQAVTALEKSVELGYDDVDWMQKDTDLDNIRNDPRYKGLVERLRRAGAGNPE
ncbi:MAG: tetratricopeptide repeat protein [Planctomycetota bacterium]